MFSCTEFKLLYILIQQNLKFKNNYTKKINISDEKEIF